MKNVEGQQYITTFLLPFISFDSYSYFLLDFTGFVAYVTEDCSKKFINVVRFRLIGFSCTGWWIVGF
ncbi:hypothetical protein, partial [Enterococcus mundtii]|uniref:hypothetical protein n=1 Tax=Enterococcus mundtii TaxID=53346 RepID=UPI0035C6C1E2